MKLKSHFTFSKKQRNGIFLLLFLIIALQCVYFFVEKPAEDIIVNQNELNIYLNELDSLKQVKAEESKPKIFPFNPNFITDHKGYTLGMSNEEIDRLHNFRAQDKWINSTADFQRVTGVSDSLLNVISPYFKFPEWVTNPKPKPQYSSFSDSKDRAYRQAGKSHSEKIDLNKATAQQLQKVYGIGETFSKRIIDYRRKHSGFVADVELTDVYGLSPEVVERIKQHFTVKTPRSIAKIPLNTATAEQLVTVQYIDYEVAHNIIEERTLRDGFKTLDELTKVKDFPIHKFEIIELYLVLN